MRFGAGGVAIAARRRHRGRRDHARRLRCRRECTACGCRSGRRYGRRRRRDDRIAARARAEHPEPDRTDDHRRRSAEHHDREAATATMVGLGRCRQRDSRVGIDTERRWRSRVNRCAACRHGGRVDSRRGEHDGGVGIGPGRHDGGVGIGPGRRRIERRAQRGRERPRVGIALRGLLRHRGLHDDVKRRRQGRHALRHRRRVLVQHLVDQRRRRPAEGPLAGEQLVQDHAAGIEVAAAVDGFSGELLGRHVRHGAEHRPELRELGRVEAGDAEIGDLHAAVVEQDDVAGLDVAVDDAALVRMLQRGEELGHHAAGLGEREAPARVEQALQVATAHQLHRDERRIGAGVLAVLVDADDARVAEPAGGLGLAPEAHAQLGGEVGVSLVEAQHLDGDRPLDHRVVALVDHAHGAAPELAPDQVLAEALGGVHRGGACPLSSAAVN